MLESGPLCVPLIEAAGTDISHWFDPKTKDPKTFVDPCKLTLMFFKLKMKNQTINIDLLVLFLVLWSTVKVYRNIALF